MRNQNSRAVQRAGWGLVVCGLLGLASCDTSPKYPESWHSDRISTDSERVLWEVTVLSFEKHSFPAGTGLDPSTMVATSGWKYDLQPFRGKGWRDRAEVSFEAVEGGSYDVRVRVERQINMDIVRPLDISYAEWEQAPDNDLEARLLLLRIKSWIGGDLNADAAGR